MEIGEMEEERSVGMVIIPHIHQSLPSLHSRLNKFFYIIFNRIYHKADFFDKTSSQFLSRGNRMYILIILDHLDFLLGCWFGWFDLFF